MKLLTYSKENVRYNLYIFLLLLGLFFSYIIFFWPGIMSPDSVMQYGEACSGMFSDHHPPMMAILWRLLRIFYDGPGLIFLLHITMLFAACFILMQSFDNYRIKMIYAFYPLFPPVYFYAAMIWKDVGFAFSYLLVSSCIVYYSQTQGKPSWKVVSILFLILFYGTGVKFQALFVAPVMIFGVFYMFFNQKITVKVLITTIISYLILYFSLQHFNAYFVEDRTSNAWKFVKIYDLAAISLALNVPLFPDYILNYEKFSLDAVRDRFNYERVDDLVFFSDSPIAKIETEKDRSDLLNVWYSAVISHPYVYSKHRFKNWIRIVFAKPFEKLETIDFKDYARLGFISKMFVEQTPWKIFLAQSILHSIKIVRYFFSFGFLFFLALAYLFLGFLRRNHSLGVVLSIINGAALLLVFSLLPFSMASSLRYVYMAVCLIHASHPIAYLVLTQKK